MVPSSVCPDELEARALAQKSTGVHHPPVRSMYYGIGQVYLTGCLSQSSSLKTV